ncbi:MAG: hypothetical protein Q9182_000290 [Xanthomendoza sp. 2 TL-2023]
MFDNYSIAVASQAHALDEKFYIMDDDDDDISPTSSRTTTPAPEETNMLQSPFSIDPVAELSYRLQQHTLQARSRQQQQQQQQQQLTPFEPPTLSPSSSEPNPPPTSSLGTRRRKHTPSLLIWQQRQAMTRRQCTPAHLSHISALVQQMSHDPQNPYFDLAAPRSSSSSGGLSPTSTSTLASSLDSTPSSSGSEDCCPDNGEWAPSRILAGKIEKEWRRGAAGMGGLNRGQKLVLRKIRMRKGGRRGGV